MSRPALGPSCGAFEPSLLIAARALTTHVNRGIEPKVNVVESTMTSRLRDFVRMNLHIFLRSMVGEDPQEFLDRMYKVLSAMIATSSKKV